MLSKLFKDGNIFTPTKIHSNRSRPSTNQLKILKITGLCVLSLSLQHIPQVRLLDWVCVWGWNSVGLLRSWSSCVCSRTHTHMRKSNENNSVIFHSSLIGVCRQIQHCVCFLNEGTSYAAIMDRLKDTERQWDWEKGHIYSRKGRKILFIVSLPLCVKLQRLFFKIFYTKNIFNSSVENHNTARITLLLYRVVCKVYTLKVCVNKIY